MRLVSPPIKGSEIAFEDYSSGLRDLARA